MTAKDRKEGVLAAFDAGADDYVAKPYDIRELHARIKYKAAIVKALGDVPIIHAYPQRLDQVFMNILVNAGQAIDKNGRIRILTRHVKAGRRQSDERIVVTIADNGMGIPEAILEKIFAAFFTTPPVGEGSPFGFIR